VDPGESCDLNPCCAGDGTTCVGKPGQMACYFSGGLPDASFCFGAGGFGGCGKGPSCCSDSTCENGGACCVSDGGYCDNERLCCGQLVCNGLAPAGATNYSYAGICQPFCAAVGSSCLDGTPCCAGATCTNGSCVSNGASGNNLLGGPCLTDPDCQTNDCDPVGKVCCTGIGSGCDNDADCCGGSSSPKFAICSDDGGCCLPTGSWCQSGGSMDATCCSLFCDTAGQCL